MEGQGREPWSHAQVPVELDLDDITVPLTRERVVGLQRELLDRLSSRDVQARLRQMERTHAKGSLAYRRLHQELFLSIQYQVLPKYGFEASTEGVTSMLSALQPFSLDPEAHANARAINAFIAGTPTARRPEAASSQPPFSGAKAMPRKLELWRDQEMQRHQRQAQRAWQDPDEQDEAFWEAHPPPSAGSAINKDLVSYGGPPVELDMQDIRVPVERDMALAMQEEFRQKVGSEEFQATLLTCFLRHPSGSMAFRRAHQQLVFEVQSSLLPKYGFAASMDGVVAVCGALQAFEDDPEVAANMRAIDKLIWGPANMPKARSSLAPPPGQQQLPVLLGNAGSGLTEDRGSLEHRGHIEDRGRLALKVTQVAAGDGFWRVCGGQRTGGIVVRISKDARSTLQPVLLATGTVIKELERSGERLHFLRVSGDGPDYGWISPAFKGKSLLEPYEGLVPYHFT